MEPHELPDFSQFKSVPIQVTSENAKFIVADPLTVRVRAEDAVDIGDLLSLVDGVAIPVAECVVMATPCVAMVRSSLGSDSPIRVATSGRVELGGN